MPTRDGALPLGEAGPVLAWDQGALPAFEDGASTFEAWLKPHPATAIMDAESTRTGTPDLFMVTALSPRAQSCQHAYGGILVFIGSNAECIEP